MKYYYVVHPSLPITAVVSAPSTEKARTTFLDYLERNGQINRSQRQDLRKAMATKNISSPDEVSSDVQLHYDFEDGGAREYPAESLPLPIVDQSEPEESAEPFYEPIETSVPEPSSVTQDVGRMSPIERLSLTGRL